MYPIDSMVHFGIFVKEQVDHISDMYDVDSKVYFLNAREEGKTKYLRSLFEIPRLIRKMKPDVIHIHYGISGLFLLFYRPQADVYLTFHGGDVLADQGFYFQNIISTLVARRVKKVFVLNSEMEVLAKSIGTDFELLPCGVDTDFFTPLSKGVHLNTKPLIIFPGDPKLSVKNYALFKEVVQSIESRLGETIEIKCICGMSRNEVRDTLAAADCLVMTSISEGSPQVVKEALACNLPVVSVDVGDVRTVLQDIPSCHIATTYDSSTLADFVLEVLADARGLIRDAFIAKGQYDNVSICKRLYDNYCGNGSSHPIEIRPILETSKKWEAVQ